MQEQDFNVWWDSYLRNHPGTKVSRAEALARYHEFYDCQCVGCEYRKSHGLIPIRQHPGCTAPIEGEILAGLT